MILESSFTVWMLYPFAPSFVHDGGRIRDLGGSPTYYGMSLSPHAKRSLPHAEGVVGSVNASMMRQVAGATDLPLAWAGVP